MAPPYRPRRTCLAVPGSSPRFLDKARGLPVDEVFLDLEDAVAPAAKPAARAAVVAALNGGGWGGKIRAVRINDVSTPWAYRDVIEVVEEAGANLDVIVLPKVSGPGPGQLAGPAARPGRAGRRAGAGPDRHRGADRGRPRPGRGGRDRGRVRPAGGPGVRPGRLHGQHRHAVAPGRAPSRTGTPAAMRTTTRGCGSWSPRAAAGSPPSTARIWPSTTSTGCGAARPARRRSATTGNGCCIPGQVDVVNEVFAPGPGQL